MSDFLFSVIDNFGYLGIFLCMVLEAVIIIIPSEAILATSGILASMGIFTFFGAFGFISVVTTWRMPTKAGLFRAGVCCQWNSVSLTAVQGRALNQRVD